MSIDEFDVDDASEGVDEDDLEGPEQEPANEPAQPDSGGTGSTAESNGLDEDAVEGLEGAQFASVLAAAWTNRGWATDVAADDGTFLVTGDRGDGHRGLILVLPGDVTVPGKRLQQYVSLAAEKSVAVRVVATQGEFTDDAAHIADETDVYLLDPRAVLETIEAEGLEDAVGKDVTNEGGLGSGIAGAGAALLSRLPVSGQPTGIPGRGGSLPNPGGTGLAAVVVVLLIATSLLGGFAGGAFLTPDTGGPAGVGGSDGGVVETVTAALDEVVGGDSGGDLAVAALSTAEDDAGLVVRWNARTTDTVVANGSTYRAPTGTQFLVVQLSVTNTGSERVPVHGADVLVNVNGTRYTPQPLEGARTFESTALSPGEETTGWVVFAVSTGATDAVLVPRTEVPGRTVTFRYDPALLVGGRG